MRFCLLLFSLLLVSCGPRPATQAGAPAPGAKTANDPGIPAGRLDGSVLPSAYRLELTILPQRESFEGITEIDVQISEPTSVIYLHGNGLSVSSARLSAAGQTFAAAYAQVDDTGVARLAFDRPVPAGGATLRIEYTADFRSRAEGLYRTEVDGRFYAFTQFQVIDARRVFPGFDEPAFKTPFDITVVANSADTVISNTPVVAEQPAEAGRKRLRFLTTEPLPTYLLAFAVGPLDVVAGQPIPANALRPVPLPLRAVATRGKGGGLRFVLDNTEEMVRYLEEYFAVAYPYPKLDLIASPEFGTGAMENAGAIVYGDALILLADNASVEQKQRLGATHAHELAHHWFGDLVTPEWWDDTWLNESFASWMGNKAAHAWRPEYQLDVVSLVQALAAMNLDSRIAARQVRQPVEKNRDIASSFDAITYLKGGGVLSMFENYLGEAGFREGMRLHMRRYAHSVADVDDFMTSLADGSNRPDVVPAFRSFIEQPGVPIVDVVLSCDAEGAALQIAQSRYLPVGSAGDPAQTWQLPFCVSYSQGNTVGKSCQLLAGAQARMPLTDTGCPDWVMPNAQGAGYYRFSLDESGWRKLLAGFEQLDQKEGLAVADSLSAAYQADRLPTGELVDALRSVAASPHALVAMAPAKDLVRLSEQVVSPDQRAAVRELMRDFYGPRLQSLAGSPEAVVDGMAAVERALFRTKLVSLLALDAEDPALRRDLAQQASRYLGTNPGEALDKSALDASLVAVALAAGVQELGEPFIETLITRLLASGDSRFRADAATALGTTDDPALGDRVRELLLDERLRGREPTTLAFALADRPSQRRATFDWFKANQPEFTARLSTFAHRWLPRMGEGFCTGEERDEVETFFEPLLSRLQGAERTLAEVLEGIELCAALREARGAEADAYFAGL